MARKPTRALSESSILRVLLLAASDMGVRLFRNNVGRLQDRYGTWVAYGLHPGSPDLIGWQTVTITPEMVGQRVALFVGVEVKREDGERVSEDQRRFLAALTQAGAVAGVARSVADLERILGVGNDTAQHLAVEASTTGE